MALIIKTNFLESEMKTKIYSNSRTIKFVGIGAAVFFIVIIIYLFLSNEPSSIDPDYVVKKIEFKKYNTQLYLNARFWGVSADHEVICLSVNDKKITSIDSMRNFVFEGESVLFYKSFNDTLRLYVAKKAATPPLFKSRIKIIQVELENREMMNLFENDNFRKKGFSKFE
jgi:hypothetical protein